MPRMSRARADISLGIYVRGAITCGETADRRYGHECERWLWHAIDPHSGTGLAYVFGRRKAKVFLALQDLLEPFGITRCYTDGWGAYERHIPPKQHVVGKENTPRIESKHIHLRTRIKRLVRRTICFSKTTTMHDLVIGLFINRYECGRLL